ncbi:hypothetical protein FOL47_006251 [Perkinsus chesapeaki]|uniref:Uncharacterized protein n=1 Tax=Perkinsus chesapeaki TaxID=330153 RepID=A0A7J6LUB3_PERCH|nr:hypothetical protein FOL47_006251 [Perkinsus chesapeaki]
MAPLTIGVAVDGDNIALLDCPTISVSSSTRSRRAMSISGHEKVHYWAQRNLLFVRCSSVKSSARIDLRNVFKITREPLKRAGWAIKREDPAGLLNLSWDASDAVGHVLCAGTSRSLLPLALVITDSTALSLWAIREYLKCHGQYVVQRDVANSRLSAFSAYPAPVCPNEVSLPSFISSRVSEDSLSIEGVLSKLLAPCEADQMKGLYELHSVVSCGLVSPLCRENAGKYRATLQDSVTSSGGLHALFSLVESCKDTKSSDMMTLVLECILRLLENNKGKASQIVRHIDCFPVLLSALERFHRCNRTASLVLKVTHMLLFEVDSPIDGVLSRPFTLEILRALNFLDNPLDVIIALDILVQSSNGEVRCPEALSSLLALRASWQYQPSGHLPILADRNCRLLASMRSLFLITAGCLIDSSVVAPKTTKSTYKDTYPKSDTWQGTGEVHTNIVKNAQKCTLHKELQMTPNDNIDTDTRKRLGDKYYANNNLVTVALLPKVMPPRDDILDDFEWVDDEGSVVAREHSEASGDGGNLRTLTVDRVSCGPRAADDFTQRDFKDLGVNLNGLLPTKEYPVEVECGKVWMDIHHYMFDNAPDYKQSQRRDSGSVERILKYMCDMIYEAKKGKNGVSPQVEGTVERLVAVVSRLSDPRCNMEERQAKMKELKDIGESPLMLESVCLIISDLGRYPPQVGMEALNLLIREGVMKRWGQSADGPNGGRYFEASKEAVRSTLQDAALALENSSMSGKAPIPKFLKGKLLSAIVEICIRDWPSAWTDIITVLGNSAATSNDCEQACFTIDLVSELSEATDEKEGYVLAANRRKAIVVGFSEFQPILFEMLRHFLSAFPDRVDFSLSTVRMLRALCVMFRRCDFLLTLEIDVYLMNILAHTTDRHLALEVISTLQVFAENISKPRPVPLPEGIRPCTEAELGRLILAVCSLSEKVNVASITASQSSVYEMHRQTAYLLQQMIESSTYSFLIHHPSHLGVAVESIKRMWNYPSPYLQLSSSTALEMLARRVCARTVAEVNNSSGVNSRPCRMVVWNEPDTLAEYFYHLWVVCQKEPHRTSTDLYQHYRTAGMGPNGGNVEINAYCSVWKRLSEEDREAYGDDINLLLSKCKGYALGTMRTMLSIPDSEVSMRHATAVKVCASILDRDDLNLKEYSAGLGILECLLKPFVLPAKPSGQIVQDPKANLDETDLKGLLCNIVARACVAAISNTGWTSEHLMRFYEFVPCAADRLPPNVLGGLLEKCLNDGSRPTTMPEDGSLNTSIMTSAQNAVLSICKKLSAMSLDKTQLIASLAGVSRNHGVLSCSWAVEGLLLLGLSPEESKCIYDEVANTLVKVTQDSCRFECIAIETADDTARKVIKLLSMCLSCLSAGEAAGEKAIDGMEEVLVEFANAITPSVMKWMTLLHNRCSGSWWIPCAERRSSSAAEDQLVDMSHDEWTSIMGHKPPCTVEAMFPLPPGVPGCTDKSRRQLYQLRCNVYRALGALATIWRRVPTLKCRLIELVGAAVSAAQSGRTSPNHLELLLRYAIQPGLKDASSGPLVEASTILYSNVPSALRKVYDKGAPQGDKSGNSTLLFYSAIARCGKTVLESIRELLKLSQIEAGVDLRLAPAESSSLPADRKTLTKRQLRNRNHFEGLDLMDSDNDSDDGDNDDDVVPYMNDKHLIKSLLAALSSLLAIPHLTLGALSLMNVVMCRCWSALSDSLDDRQNFCLAMVECFIRSSLENLATLPQLAYLGGDGALTDLLGDPGRKQTPLLDGVVKVCTTGFLVLGELYRRQCEVAGSPASVDNLFLCPPLFDAIKMLCAFTGDDDGVKGWIELVIDTTQGTGVQRKQVSNSLKGMLKSKGSADSKVVVVGEQGGDQQLLKSVAAAKPRAD